MLICTFKLLVDGSIHTAIETPEFCLIGDFRMSLFRLPFVLLQIISETEAEIHAAATLQWQFRLYIPFLGIVRPQPKFPHSCVCELFI
jgi:hypothetical protein